MEKKPSYWEYFTQAYLMLIGIIQATVFTSLARDFYLYLNSTYSGLDGLVLNLTSALGDATLLFYVTTFGIITVVTYEYFAGLQYLQRPVQPTDVAAPLFLGFTEAFVAGSVQSAIDWWGSVLLFGFAAILIFLNLISNPIASIYKNKPSMIKPVRRYYMKRLVFSICHFAFIFLVYLCVHLLQLNDVVLGYLALAYLVIFSSLFMFSTSSDVKEI